MTDSFSSINGDNLTQAQVAVRLKAIDEILKYLSDPSGNCCRLTPDWRARAYQYTFHELKIKYKVLFGHTTMFDALESQEAPTL